MPEGHQYEDTDFGPTIESVRSVGQAFASAGYELFLVGGVVRDRMLGAEGPSADVDLATSARPDVIRKLLEPLASALWTQGERFGTIGARIGQHDVEITTYRAEDYDPNSRKPEVAFGNDLRADLARRDFTINAMAVSLVDAKLHDPFGGCDDLSARRLRTPLDPLVSFADDPLRMLRAARFVPRFDLDADPALLLAAQQLARRLDIVSRERVHDELERLLAVPQPRRGLEFLARAGLLPLVLGFDPESDAVVDSFRLVDADVDPVRRRVGLLLPHGVDAAGSVLARLRYSTDDRRRTVLAISLLEGLTEREPSAAAGRRLVADARHDLTLVDDVLAIGHYIEPTRARADELRAVLDRLLVNEPLVPGGPPLDGETIMATLGLEPGPMVGDAVAYLEQRRIERGPMSSDEAIAELREWAVCRPA